MTDKSSSLWAPLRIPAFRWLWLGALAMNLAIWMQNVGAAWLMVSLTTSPMLVALVQTAISLPSFFFGLPGGVFADIFNRRRYLMVTHLGMLGAAIVLVLACVSGMVGPVLLLALTFAFGVGFALQGPAWYTTQVEAVPRAYMASAMALSSVSYSSARAVGPALAGGVVTVSGIVSVFLACAVLLCGSLAAVLFMRRGQDTATMPPESLLSGLRGALRYARHSEVIRVQSLRTVAFVGAGSSIWALLPLVASESGGAGNYGLLLGSIGVGTMLGAFVLPPLRARLELNGMLSVACIAYGLGTLVVSLAARVELQCAALLVAGVGWMCVATTHLVVVQSAVPSWIRARSVAIYMLVFQGALAIGGAFWGLMATYLGARPALLVSVAAILMALLVMQRFQARMGEEAEAQPSPALLPEFSFARPEAQDGPVAVQVTYQIPPEDRETFLRRIHALGVMRRRNGSSHWRIYRELERPDWYTERFIVESWSDYLRQQSRATQADQETEASVHALHVGEEPPSVLHYIGESIRLGGT
ncbi:MFS transporter [Stutzerimonas xanthomarina]|jgi:MFS family permease|uniref:MFS transporter n=1 Tax=Stutzerimonas xanthomarina TaxID=271420 RepID=A0A3R8VJZ9_9GAMM|nr:MFS transporter [Stutzerimonas xanthomarina]MCW8158421.1 MFS transporter [Stutzerimonas stutzeri]RRV13424.1 MFS transporter [Stutzerimonas xanthomarina]